MEEKNIFLTGEIQIGKSTIINKVMNNIIANYGGYKGSSEIQGNKKIISFRTLSEKDKKYILAIMDHVEQKFEIRKELFDIVLKEELEKALVKNEIIIMDELGNFEENSDKFKEVVNKCLDSEKIVFGVLKKRHGKFVNDIMKRKDVKLFFVDENNRNYIPNEIVKMLKKLKENDYKSEKKEEKIWKKQKNQM